ncbi:Uncharacterized conserved protein, DUF849 family [Bradyrhizobium sp. Rc2d]|uniref:3-keto-5-aminohexanoate cleavage protein n=1 Tax=Bradyrhizobium sp. Rc2d TaxID=1855321 RepID=UPI000891DE61|nr:3-keto-5-aminohexanoate cleavage protein [Bradyrhizobium sp. Rc2d]SDG72061.1 Uncharacterized conserved protein, DUF849 family [Bradyrhizobium sp. Rc2d]
MARKQLIIEARINEYTPRSENRHIPFSPLEIGEAAARACRAGASIVHFHARHGDGSPDHRAETYAAAIRAIRERCDVLVYPTLGQVTAGGEDEDRIRHIEALAGDPATRPDIAPIDTGSTNIDRFKDGGFRSGERTYVNRTGTLRFFAERLRTLGVKPQFVSWAVPFTRMFEALRETGLVDAPAWFVFELTGGGILGGHPGTIDGLEAHLRFLPGGPLEWSVSNKIGNVTGQAALAIERDGHVSAGLGDYGWPELGCPDNGAVIQFIANLSRAMGREVASVAQTRDMLGL